jgi:transcriptional regulator with XRE-family HTH domain
MWLRRWLAQQLIGEDLKAMRLRKRLSQRQLARRSGISEKTISRVENGVGTINFGCLVLLSLAMGETPTMFRSIENLSMAHLRELRAATREAAERFRRRRR